MITNGFLLLIKVNDDILNQENKSLTILDFTGKINESIKEEFPIIAVIKANKTQKFRLHIHYDDYSLELIKKLTSAICENTSIITLDLSLN